MMHKLTIIIALLVFQPMALACTPDEWGQTQNDLSWTVYQNEPARRCVGAKVAQGGLTFFDAILYCNSGADKDRILRCGAESCNWLKARGLNPAC